MNVEGTVFIVDDDPEMRDALVRLMDQVRRPCRAYASAEEFLVAYDGTVPGCVVVDVRMGGMSGIDMQRELIRRESRLPVIVITGFGEIPMAVESMRRGAIDFIEKPFRSQPLLDSIQRALTTDAQARRRQTELASIRERVARLTVRERQVIDLVVAGLTNRAIARQFGVSSQAVDARRSNAMAKLEIDSVAALARLMMDVDEEQEPARVTAVSGG